MLIIIFLVDEKKTNWIDAKGIKNLKYVLR